MASEEWVDLTDAPLIADVRWLHEQSNGAKTTELPVSFAGLSHQQVLALEFPPERMLVKDLVPIGAVGTIAGVPETFKSWQAQQLAVMIASGEGELFGKGVEHPGPVGYFWQDDSTREEAERIKLYDSVHRDGSELAIRWFLNEGLRLPDDMARLRATIVENRFCMVVLDSFYNVLFGLDLKDEGAEIVISRLKSEVCDVTGCTVLIVDHMPWATDQNRNRLRAYGGVHKGAAIRFGIYIDAVKNKLYVEARGNNITGFKRQPAEWDSETLELRLCDEKAEVSDEEYEQRIIDHLTENRDQTVQQMNAITGGREALLAARMRLLATGTVEMYKGGSSGRKEFWNLSNDAGSTGTQESLDSLESVEPAQWVHETTGTPLRGGAGGVPIGSSDTDAEVEDDGIPF